MKKKISSLNQQLKDFLSTMGISIKQYITEKKITEGCNLLKNSNLSITEISDKLGYTTPHSFSQNFKKITGVSPTEYKTQQSWIVC